MGVYPEFSYCVEGWLVPVFLFLDFDESFVYELVDVVLDFAFEGILIDVLFGFVGEFFSEAGY